MIDFIQNFLDTNGFTPHGFCLTWRPDVFWTEVIADSITALSYFSIPFALMYFARRRPGQRFAKLGVLFGLFIALCGITHALDVVTLWVPVYGIQALAKLATALVSVGTAVSLWWLMPFALSLPSHRDLERINLELRQSEERFRATFEQAATGFIHTAFDGRFLRFNQKFCNIIGYSPDEAAQLTYQEITHPDDLDFSNREVAAMRAGKIGNASWEKRYVRKDGRVVWVRLTCSIQSDAEGKPLHFITVVEDISRQKQAEAALLRERDFIQSVVDGLPGIFYVINEGGSFDLWNHNMETVTGYSTDEMARLSARDLFEGEDREVIGQRIAQVFANGSADAEALLRSKSGSFTPYFFSGLRLLDADGVKLIGMGLNISERRELEEELRRSNDDLKQFAYVASHDLRQPLRMVSSYLTLLERRYSASLDDDGREFIRFARDGAARMDHLIIDLLEYSRIGRHGQPPEPLDLEQVMGEAARNLQLLIEDTGGQIECASPSAPVHGNRTELVRLFQNLISNAVKYRDPERKPNVRVAWEQKGGDWLVSIHDNGIGIPAEFLQDVFKIFRRLHTSGEYEGTGIGLAVCQKIVEHHGGRVWAESQVGEGSRFYFTIPKA